MLSTNIAAGGFTDAIAMADFNGDGNLDLAVPAVNGSTNFVSIFLGDGAGNFSVFTNLPLFVSTYYVVVADFNNDGKLDVAFSQADRISVRLGNGLGGFSGPVDFFGGMSSAGAVGDFDNDGNADLAIRSRGAVSIILGDGTGGFHAATRYAAGLTDHFKPNLAVGDFNGDAKLDLAAASSSPTFILIGGGDGTFVGARDFVTGRGALAIVSADFNRDGAIDLAVPSTGMGEVCILLGSGTGEFGPATKFQVGNFPRNLAIGDFNGDNKEDLAVTNFSSNNVSILLGNGSGGFSPSASVAVGTNPDGITISDFNNDGKQDLAVANVTSANLSIVLGQGNGSFQAAIPVSLPSGSRLRFVYSADINSDGKVDLVVTGTGSQLKVSILLGNGLGGFGPASLLNQSSFSVAIADFNGDGNSDLLAYSEANMNVLLGNGSGGFSAPISQPSPFIGPLGPVLAAGDFNGDGKLDAAAATFFGCIVEIYAGDGHGALAAPTRVYGGSSLGTMAVDDFNGDGKQDLAVPNEQESATIFINNLPCTPDTTAPTISCEAPDGLWHPSDINLSCIATDSGSGLVNATDANFTLSTNVPLGIETSDAFTNARTICDLAGNCSTANPIGGNQVDKKAPDIEVIAPVEFVDPYSNLVRYLLSQTALSNFSCSDSGSGVAMCTGSVANGTPINTSTVGTKAFSVATVDAAGNAASTSITYGVTYAIFMLYNSTQSFNAKAKQQIKIQLQNVNGVNQSSSTVSVNAVRVTPRGNPNVTAKVINGAFIFDAALAFSGSAPGGGYKYSLDPSGLAPGDYDVIFNVANDPVSHAVPFSIK
jgi:hypothetical protein